MKSSLDHIVDRAAVVIAATAGELMYASMQVGLGVAVEYALDQGMSEVWERVQGLAALLRQRLQEHVPGIAVHDRGRRLCGIVSFTLVRPQGHIGACIGGRRSAQA